MARMVTFLLGAAAGAAAGYFLDPANGARRRHQTRDQAFSKARRGKDQAARQATQAANMAQGAVHKVTPSGPSEPPDDITLARKVETEIFRAPDAPKGRVSVNAENGVVFLRGEVDEPQWITRLGDEASRVPGVAAVRNLLHTPAAPAPTAPGTRLTPGRTPGPKRPGVRVLSALRLRRRSGCGRPGGRRA